MIFTLISCGSKSIENQEDNMFSKDSTQFEKQLISFKKFENISDLEKKLLQFNNFDNKTASPEKDIEEFKVVLKEELGSIRINLSFDPDVDTTKIDILGFYKTQSNNYLIVYRTYTISIINAVLLNRLGNPKENNQTNLISSTCPLISLKDDKRIEIIRNSPIGKLSAVEENKGFIIKELE